MASTSASAWQAGQLAYGPQRPQAVRPVPRKAARRAIPWRQVWPLLADVLMVALWAAMVPGLMWLGAAAGF
ncbi:hypothetical protein [Castellaniella caeni]|uniref:hypothetical protein n=1 Tax=Castellaniella caeni TaxID=266123 RepID=UPI0008345891|nr:hypothetical protein [Castellaniella caeni]